MTPVDCFRLDASGYEATGQSTILDRGQRVGAVVGCRIDAQFDAGTLGAVLFVSPNTIFVGLLHVVLVQDGRVREDLALGDAMAEGLATEFEVSGPASIRFRFPFDEPRCVRVERRATWLGLREQWLHLN